MPILLRPSTSAARVIGGPIRRTSMNNGVVGGGFPLISSFDGPDSVYAPLTTSDFGTLGLAVPNYTWLCQETSGDLTPTLGGVTLAANGSGHLYQQTISSWSRKAVGSAVDNDVVAWRALSGSGPEVTDGSVAWLGYFFFPSLPGNVRTFFNIKGAAPQVICRLDDTGTLAINMNAVQTSGVYNYVDGRVHPIAFVYDKTALTGKIYTDKEIITGTYTDIAANGNKGLGGVTGNGTCVYRCLWLAAYGLTNAQQNWPNYLRALRWNLAY